MMTDQPIVQVSRLLDERGLSSFQIKLIVWSFFIVLIDGYDIAAIAFAAPDLVRSWGVAPSALGPVFSASLVGILFGSAIFGWVGDRFGRKAALVTRICCSVFSPWPPLIRPAPIKCSGFGCLLG
jgi:MFS transporter, AAHS family, 4-hydroxybenzoate transporter